MQAQGGRARRRRRPLRLHPRRLQVHRIRQVSRHMVVVRGMGFESASDHSFHPLNSPWVCNCDHPWADHTQRTVEVDIHAPLAASVAASNEFQVRGFICTCFGFRVACMHERRACEPPTRSQSNSQYKLNHPKHTTHRSGGRTSACRCPATAVPAAPRPRGEWLGKHSPIMA